MKINYRQCIGELIYAMDTCRPDISFPLIKLSQYSINPAKEHYEAVKELFYYLQCTKSEGIYFWRSQHNNELPASTKSFDMESLDCEVNVQDDTTTMKTATDSDWGETLSTENQLRDLS